MKSRILSAARLSFSLASAIAALLAAAPAVHAATYYWDNNSTTAGYGTAGGTWTVPTVSLWSTSNNGTGTPGASITTSTGDTLNFGNGATGLGAGTITVSGTVASGNMTFASGSGSILLSGGTINFVAASTITVNNASNTIGSGITGAATSLTKAGTGTLILNGANSYAGQTIVNAGNLTIGGSHSGNGNITVNAAGAMTISGTYSGSGTVNLNGGAFDLGGSTAGGTLASTVLNLNGGSFSFTRNDSATHSFTTTNINSAGSTISAALGNTLNLGNLVSATGGTLDFSTTGAGTVATTTANVGGILSGFTHGNSWAVANGAGVAISALADGSYTLSSVAGTTGSNYTGNNIDVDNSAGTLDAGITANSLRFSAAGANTLSLTGTNTVSTGGILVGSGVGSNLSTITGGTLRGASSSDLKVIQNNTSGGLTISSNIVNNTSTSVTKAGAGLLTLSGTNTFTGGLFINAGEVALGITGALNSTAGSENAVTFGAGSTGTLSLKGNSVVVRSLTSNANNPGVAIVQNASAGAATLTIGNSANQASSFAGTIQDGSGGGALTVAKSGTGTLTLSGTNTYTGGTVLNAGTLAITSDANLGATSGDLTFAGNSTLNMNATGFVMNAGRTITVNSGVTATLTSNNDGKRFAGSLEGSGTVYANHSTSFVFDNASAFTGSFRASTANSSGYGLDMYTLRDEAGDGTITLESGSFRWFGSGGTKTFDDRQFFLGGNGSIYNRSTDNSAIVISTNLGQSGTGTRTLTLGGNNSAAGTFAGNIGNNGASAVTLTKTEGNIWALGGTNTYTGDTNLLASGTTGVLIFQGAQSLSSGTTLKFAQASSSVQSVRFLDDGVAPGIISFNRPIEFGGSNTLQNLNIAVGNNNTNNGGSSAGTTTGRTIQVGNITFTSTAADTNTTTINATSPNSNGYRLQTGVITLNNLVTRTAGQTTVTALNPTSANMTVGSITMANGNTGIANDGVPVLRLTGTSSDNRVTGIISNAADFATGQALSLQKQGTSTWVLEGDNTYTGATSVTAGALIINGNSSTATGAVSVTGASALATATLGGIGIVGGNTTLNNFSVLSPGQSPGTLTFSSALTLNNGATYTFEGGDLVAVGGILTLTDNWILALGSGLSDGGSVTLFTYGTAGGFDLAPTFDITNLGFSPSGALSLSDTGSSIVLNGLSVVPEPGAPLICTLGLLVLLRRRRN